VGDRSADDMLIQAILLTSSLLLVLGMVGSLMWLAALRVRDEAEPIGAVDERI
jgi:hypothetical protein